MKDRAVGNDLDIIKQLEEGTGITLEQVSIKDFEEYINNVFFNVLIAYEEEGAYALDEEGRITGLCLGNVTLQPRHVKLITRMKSLQQLSLFSTHCPDYTFLHSLPNLTFLDLSHNNLSDGSVLSSLSNLTSLYLSYNNLSDVSFLKDLGNLRFVSLDDNPVKNPPPEIVKKGIGAIRNYFKQLEEQGRARLYEAKLLFVGEPGAGKTTLMKKILDPDYPVPNKEEEPTLGIEIDSSWEFPYSQDKSITFRTNMWDFGGQPIQYMLHQYFLTSRSLYVLVSDDREQRTRFDYWFDIIKVLGENSPVLVVLNEKKHRSISDFDYDKYRKRYAPYYAVEKRDVDLSKKDGRIRALVTKIEEMVCALEHIGDELPAQWVPIRKELETIKSQNQVGIARYFEICKAHGLKEERDMLTLCGYLNALGVILHYKDDRTLENTIFVNPHWIVDALYTALSDKTLADNRGTFEKKWLFGLWQKKGYSFDERCKLLNLMLKDNFEICYPIMGKKEEYMVPMLLPDVEPGYSPLPAAGTLKFRYQYSFLPEGIVSRLIVRLHEDIDKEDGRDVIWKRGVVFRRKNTRARVVEDRSEKGLEIIDITTAGEVNARLELLTIIREEIHKIHNKSFQDISVEEMVPCCCGQCREAVVPHYFEYSELLRYLRAGETFIKCSKSVKSVNITDLIEAVIPRQEYRDDYETYRPKDFRSRPPGHGEFPLPAYPGQKDREDAAAKEQKIDKKELSALDKMIREVEEVLETEKNKKTECGKIAEARVNRFNWWVFGFNMTVLAAWAALIFTLKWDTMEKWTYLAGAFVVVVNSLYFALFRRKFSSEAVKKKRAEEERKKLYNLHGVNIKKINRLEGELAEARARRVKMLK